MAAAVADPASAPCDGPLRPGRSRPPSAGHSRASSRARRCPARARARDATQPLLGRGGRLWSAHRRGRSGGGHFRGRFEGQLRMRRRPLRHGQAPGAPSPGSPPARHGRGFGREHSRSRPGIPHAGRGCPASRRGWRAPEPASGPGRRPAGTPRPLLQCALRHAMPGRGCDESPGCPVLPGLRAAEARRRRRGARADNAPGPEGEGRPAGPAAF